MLFQDPHRLPKTTKFSVKIFRHLKKYSKPICAEINFLPTQNNSPLLLFPGGLKYKSHPTNYRTNLHCTGGVCCLLLGMTSSEILRESGRRLFGIEYDTLGPSGKTRRREKVSGLFRIRILSTYS